MKRILVVFVLSFIALIQINCASNNGTNNQSQSGTKSSDASPSIPITASELIEAYRMEGADGAGKYKGKTLAVTGTVARTGKDYMNKLYVNLKSETNSVMEIHCTYNEEQKATMSSLKEGQQVTIRGVCEGRLSASVNLKDCVLQ
jgi:hypothetical protein